MDEEQRLYKILAWIDLTIDLCQPPIAQREYANTPDSPESRQVIQDQSPSTDQ